MENFDVIILGCGPGGMEAASVLLRGGKKVAIVEKGAYGGVCLNCGCIPTKMLLGAIEPGRLLADLARRKLAEGEIGVNYKNLQNRVKRHIAGVSTSIAKGFAEKGAALFQGAGKLAGPGAVVVESAGVELSAPAIIVATGSQPGFFPGLEADHQAVLDSRDLIFIDEAPQSLCVVGAGAIGLELADFFSALGSKITLVEAAAQVAPTEDSDIAAALQQALQKNGYEIRLGVPGRKIGTVEGRASLELADSSTITADKALVATGRNPNTTGLGCETAGVRLDRRGFVEVDENLCAAPGIYAIGDVNGKVLLAHAATQQGNYVARKILGAETSPYATGPVPACIYCHPAVMRVGMSARDAAKTSALAEVSQSAFSANPIAQAHAAPEGFAKAVWLNGRLVGMAAIGVNATQLVTAAEFLVTGGYDAAKLERLMVAHPSLDEVLASAIYAERKNIA